MSKTMDISRMVRNMVDNAMTLRRDLMAKLFDPRRDLNAELGYPDAIDIREYRTLYDREGTARRVVQFWPVESWAMNPVVFETEDPEDVTEFEQAWKDLVKAKNLFHHLIMIDVISGIGRFGVLLLGIDDGKELSQPVDGFNERGEAEPSGGDLIKLLYLRSFAENVVTVQTRETDTKNPRFGQPLTYNIEFVEEGQTSATSSSVTKSVHWTRILHVADNRESSEIYGTPRMQPVYNRVYDIRKVVGSSGEMFYKGGFPGYSVETHPSDGGSVEIDTTATKEALEQHFNGLQRYIASAGVSIKSLAPQVSDPSPHVDMLMGQLAFALGVPKRKFMGSEQAQLASSQDDRTWNKRVKKRNEEYVSPMVVHPFIQRLIDVRVLPPPVEENGFSTEWPDLNTVTNLEKAEVAAKTTEALAKYVGGGVDVLIPPREYLTEIHHMDPEQVDQIMKAQEEHQEEIDESLLEELVVPDNVPEE